MCESGAWRSFDEFEELITLDELFILYETTVERQKRLIQTIGAALGASPADDDEEGFDQEYDPKNPRVQYQEGEIAAGQNILFGYQTAPAEGT